MEDSDEFDNFRPHVVHAPHDPVPIAMCCRKPHGFPGHHDIRNPQNAAWLAGFRYAKKKVFVLVISDSIFDIADNQTIAYA